MAANGHQFGLRIVSAFVQIGVWDRLYSNPAFQKLCEEKHPWLV